CCRHPAASFELGPGCVQHSVCIVRKCGATVLPTLANAPSQRSVPLHKHLPRSATRAAALGLAAAVALGLTACGPDIGTASSTDAGADLLQLPAEESPSGEITIWDRSGDLFEVFDEAIADFNETYPDVT